MRVKVIREFIDRHTKQCHKVGDELDITVERLTEILSVGRFVEIVQAAAETDEQAAAENKKTPRRNGRTRK